MTGAVVLSAVMLACVVVLLVAELRSGYKSYKRRCEKLDGGGSV